MSVCVPQRQRRAGPGAEPTALINNIHRRINKVTCKYDAYVTTLLDGIYIQVSGMLSGFVNFLTFIVENKSLALNPLINTLIAFVFNFARNSSHLIRSILGS